MYSRRHVQGAQQGARVCATCLFERTFGDGAPISLHDASIWTRLFSLSVEKLLLGTCSGMHTSGRRVHAEDARALLNNEMCSSVRCALAPCCALHGDQARALRCAYGWGLRAPWRRARAGDAHTLLNKGCTRLGGVRSSVYSPQRPGACPHCTHLDALLGCLRLGGAHVPRMLVLLRM